MVRAKISLLFSREILRGPEESTRSMERKGRYRSKIDIMASILEAAKKKKVSITGLTYGSLLSHRQIVSHLQPLIKEQLLEHQERTYSITKKGIEFLEIYNNLINTLNR
jgi:predicted transcriptional regulator